GESIVGEIDPKVNQLIQSGYVLDSLEQAPAHLRERSSPFAIPKTEILVRRAESEVIDPATGLVLVSGAIECQTQITPRWLADVCDPDELYTPDLRQTYRFRSVYDPEIQRGLKGPEEGARHEFLREAQIKDMMADIGNGTFECPQLMWNLRSPEVTWIYTRND